MVHREYIISNAFAAEIRLIGKEKALLVKDSPVAMKAEKVEYNSQNDTIIASGKVFVTVGNYNLETDNIYYDLKKDIIFARGNIYIKEAGGRIITGEKVIVKDKFREIIITEFILRFADNVILAAKLARLLDKNKINLHKAAFTPCNITCDREPIWQIKAKDTNIDYEAQRITYRHSFFEVYGVPIIYLPYFSHPTPDALAQSGLLIPSLRTNTFLLPLYYRIWSNMDFTVTPRFGKHYNIFEIEFRHKINPGSYIINASISRNQIALDNNRKSGTIGGNRFYIFSTGHFIDNNVSYGFNIKQASDKAYLRNYYEINDPYLESKIYAYNVNKENYLALEGMYFQELRVRDIFYTNDSTVFPVLRTRNIVNLNQDGSTFFNVDNHSIIYKDTTEQFLYSNLDLGITNNGSLFDGQLTTLNLSNKFNIYLINLSKTFEHQINQGYQGNQKDQSGNIIYRNIPELKAKWRYPLAWNIKENTIMKVEPIVTFVLGRNYEERFKKFTILDSTKHEPGEENIFNSSRLSGISNYEYGSRLSYGINSSLCSDLFYLDAFLGQLIYNHNIFDKGSAEYVGNVTWAMGGTQLLYRFRKDQRLRKIRDEIGLIVSQKNLTARIGFTQLNSIKLYYTNNNKAYNSNSGSDRINQAVFSISYQITPALQLGYEGRANLLSRSLRLLQRTIRMTYTKDCVSISGKLYDDYTYDSTRAGVKKISSKTVSIGLKVLNM